MNFVYHFQTNSDTTKLLQITLAWVQHQSGLGMSVLEDTQTELPYLVARWFPSLRTYLGSA
eukprot:1661091-Ditylum_brightwellii.AAC.1